MAGGTNRQNRQSQTRQRRTTGLSFSLTGYPYLQCLHCCGQAPLRLFACRLFAWRLCYAIWRSLSTGPFRLQALHPPLSVPSARQPASSFRLLVIPGARYSSLPPPWLQGRFTRYLAFPWSRGRRQLSLPCHRHPQPGLSGCPGIAAFAVRQTAGCCCCWDAARRRPSRAP